MDLERKSSADLVEFQLHANEWYVRHSRRLLQERGPDPDVHAALVEMLEEQPRVTRRLRALWALHATRGIDRHDLIELSADTEEHVRAWVVRLLLENEGPSAATLERFSVMAKGEESALVRMYLASALQRIALEDRWEILESLAGRSEDARDANIPLLLWYAAEPLVPLDPDRLVALALASEMPNLLSFAVKRVVAMNGEGEPAAEILERALNIAEDPEQRQALRDGLLELAGE